MAICSHPGSHALDRLSRDVKEAGYPTLAKWLARQPPGRPHLFVLDLWYFFRRAVEEYSTPMQGRAVREPDPLGQTPGVSFVRGPSPG